MRKKREITGDEVMALVDKAAENGDMKALSEMATGDDVRLAYLAIAAMTRHVAERSLQHCVECGETTEEEADEIRRGRNPKS